MVRKSLFTYQRFMYFRPFMIIRLYLIPEVRSVRCLAGSQMYLLTVQNKNGFENIEAAVSSCFSK